MTKGCCDIISWPLFNYAWEQRRLGELAEFQKGRGFSKGDLLPDGEPIILYGRLYTNYQTVIKTVDTFAKAKGNDVLSIGNEVIVPSSGETAEDIARASVVSKGGVLLGGDLNIIKVKSNLHPPFVALFLSNGRGKIELIKKSQGTSVVHLYNSDLKKTNILFPNLEEQQKISSLFSWFEDLITLHQRKPLLLILFNPIQIVNASLDQCLCFQVPE